MQQICHEALWARRDVRQPEFGSLPEFVFAPAPRGLGLRSEKALHKLREALLATGHIREWAEILDYLARPRGAPKKNVADGEHSRPAIKLSRSTGSRDRGLRRLKHQRPEIYEAVCRGNISIHEGSVRAGFVKKSARVNLSYGCCDLTVIGTLKARARADLLCKIFDAAGLDAQCSLLARRVDALTGQLIAPVWRQQRAATTGERQDDTPHPPTS
jgi:hypothetical protein